MVAWRSSRPFLSAAEPINCLLLFHQKSITVGPLIGEVDKRMEMDADDFFSLLCVYASIELGAECNESEPRLLRIRLSGSAAEK